MKIRIKGNSVRLRLSRTAVEELCKNGRFEEQTRFPDGVFNYALQAVDTTDQMVASIRNNRIEIGISNSLVSGWSTNDKVGFHCMVSLENNEELSLLVEKDFVCMDETVEDQSDNYPNPKMQ